MEFIHESILMVIAGMLSLTATAADWPQYGGPDGRWVADAGDHQYLQDWSKAKLVWTSETNEIGPGRGQAPRYGFRNADPKGINHWGGAASPVIADGVLFQVYLRPVGNVYNQAVVDNIANDKRHSERHDESHLLRTLYEGPSRWHCRHRNLQIEERERIYEARTHTPVWRPSDTARQSCHSV